MRESETFKLEQAQGRGSRAESLLRDPILAEAFATLEAAYTGAWKATLIDDAAGREKLFLAVNIIGKVQQHLLRVLADGKLAAAELRQIADAAERKKTWQEIK